MVGEETKVRCFSVVFLVLGLVSAIVFLLAFGTTQWLHFPLGDFREDLLYTISFGLWRDEWCSSGICGVTKLAEMDDFYHELMNTPEGNSIKGLMCVSLSFMVVAGACNIIILAAPGKIMAVLACIFWLFAGLSNAVAVALFRWYYGTTYSVYRFGWSFWLAAISSAAFGIIGLCFAIFCCCFKWYSAPARRVPATSGTGSSSVVYNTETTTSMMGPNFGGSPQSKNELTGVSNAGYGGPGTSSNVNYRI